MILRTLRAAVVAAVALTTVGGAQAAPQQARHVSHQARTATLNMDAIGKSGDITALFAVAQIDHLRNLVHGCQQRAGVTPTRESAPMRGLESSTPEYREWVAGLWQGRLTSCNALLARTLPLAGDWETSVRVVQRVYPGSSRWLLSCSSSEGGHGEFVWIGHASSPPYGTDDTPGGWMQYKQGTFWHDLDAAMIDLRSRGIRVHPDAVSYYSPEGQAVAAGWAYGHDRPGGKWTGSGC